ncbi:uncharacterized protein LOC132269828 [Cornus florida]|uniref:uncharacterized protein LOC132269828 n=1 Tax=Cornus florida TaxID=4283 RepID=UPI0028A2D0A7|nr:uncharacterized protein LOC132269828 [Cornus florida]
MVSRALRALSLEANKLPSFEPLSDVAKKEKARLRFAENAVHLIPFVIFLCVFTLWFFSNSDVDVSKQRDPIASKNEGLGLEGETDTDGTQLGLLAGTGMVDLNLSNQVRDDKSSRSEMKSS